MKTIDQLLPANKDNFNVIAGKVVSDKQEIAFSEELRNIRGP